jgi:pyruvate dehydrogenase (quinone)
MSATTVADFILQRLVMWGVHRVYGYPGDGINGLMGSFERLGTEAPAFTQVRHEEMAAFMACAHAKFTGEVGVCMATSGPGAVHLLNGLYDAKLDHQPVVAIVGQQARTALGGSYQQEIDLVSLFKDVAGEYVQMATDPAQTRHLVDRALRIALAERTVTCVIFPNDLQSEEVVDPPPHVHGTVHSSAGYRPPAVLPHDDDLRRAAELLNAGERVAMLVGQGAMHAAEEVAAVADALGAGVAKALLGKAVLPDDLPWVTGSIGLLGTKPSWDLMQDCDRRSHAVDRPAAGGPGRVAGQAPGQGRGRGSHEQPRGRQDGQCPATPNPHRVPPGRRRGHPGAARRRSCFAIVNGAGTDREASLGARCSATARSAGRGAGRRIRCRRGRRSWRGIRR